MKTQMRKVKKKIEIKPLAPTASRKAGRELQEAKELVKEGGSQELQVEVETLL